MEDGVSMLEDLSPQITAKVRYGRKCTILVGSRDFDLGIKIN